MAALLGSATGDVKMLVNDGVISRSLMEIAGLNVGNYVVSKLFGDDEVKINCGVADLQMKSGTMTPRVFVFDTENALIGITGTADFKNEKLNRISRQTARASVSFPCDPRYTCRARSASRTWA